MSAAQKIAARKVPPFVEGDTVLRDGGDMRGVVQRVWLAQNKRHWRVAVLWSSGSKATHDARQLQRVGRGRPPAEKPAVKALRVSEDVYDLIVDYANGYDPKLSLADAARELIMAGVERFSD